jgi:site-specific recombinase XerD
MATVSRRSRAARPRPVKPGRALSAWLPFWENELGARGCSEATVKNQRECLRRLAGFAGDVEPAALTPEVLESWRDYLLHERRIKASSANRYLLTVGTFFNWLVAEGAIPEAPTFSVDLAPEVLSMPPVVDRQTLKKMGEASKVVKAGRSRFVAVRDPAILSLLQDTGLRASECAGLLVDNLDLGARQVYVHDAVAKGNSSRTVTFGFETARLLGRYVRERESHKFAFMPELWLGWQGPLSYHGIWEMVRAQARNAGAIGVRPHLLRHTFAHDMKQAGVPDEVLMALAGWRTPAMLRRYGRAEREARALEAYQKVGSPVDRAKVQRGRKQQPAGRRNPSSGAAMFR